MSYDPFIRGPHPVGVRTVDLERDGRAIPVEVWYPADATLAGADLDPTRQDHYTMMLGAPPAPQRAVRDAAPAAEANSGTAPSIVFSHGFAGHRRQTTHLTTHLASHGYLVAAPDHTGNTAPEVMAWAMGIGVPSDMAAYTREVATQRVGDAQQTLSGLVGDPVGGPRGGELGVRGDAAACGITGHSFGGWTTLATAAVDARIAATLPLAPGGGDGGVLAGPTDPRVVMRDMLELDWGREVPTLTLAADDDSVLPHPMMTDLLATAPAVDRLVTLLNADHFHFCDNVEIVHDLMSGTMGEGARPSTELVPGDHAYTLTTGLGLAHFDAALRSSADAAGFLAGDLVETFASRGIEIEVTSA